ncbi:MAG: DUF4199 domain-containing protein [Prevotellaceae bacterium]|jgi:hypothetical protein|nr:DUF4199 domain-containing protein [Prevotellaceae bacterium]
MNKIKKHPDFYRMASKFGLIMGLAVSAVHFIFYLLEDRISSSFAASILTLIVVIIIVSKATLSYRKILGGYISYWHAFGYGVVIFMFAGIAGAIYSYIFNSIDPDYVYRQLEALKQQMLNSSLMEITDNVELMRETIEKTISDQKEALNYQMQHPFRSILSATFWNTFLGALFCFISSAFLRKNRREIINES